MVSNRSVVACCARSCLLTRPDDVRFTSPVGSIHDLYSLNSSHPDGLQRRNLEAARVPVPFLHFGECLHGVGSFKQSLFPQALGLGASFDTDLVYRVGRAIGAEARSIGIHACFSPVLDLGWDARWGRTQEGWGEDKVVTTHMGVAYARGLSKDGRLSDADAVVPVMKHFAAHGAPQSGRNAAPFMGHGMREIVHDIMLPFKAAVELGFVRGVMMCVTIFRLFFDLNKNENEADQQGVQRNRRHPGGRAPGALRQAARVEL